MTKKLVLCLLFFTVSPFALLISGYLLGVFNEKQILGETIAVSPAFSGVFIAEEEKNEVVAPLIIAKDSTPIIIENYLKRYQSPLLLYVDKILAAAEKYNVQPRLIVAIAQQESNLGKNSPEGCYNAWGWGIHSKGTKCFSNWEEAIDVVTRGISRDYCAKGYCDDPCIMMKKYTPKSNGSWCAGVKQFLAELESGDF